MKIEVLFPEVTNLYGDMSNVDYLRHCVPDAHVIGTTLKSEPAFVNEKVDLIYMGSMKERAQEMARDNLSVYKDRIRELIDGGQAFLITGNALEVFIDRIEETDLKGRETVKPMLGLFPLYCKRNMANRYNSLYWGKFEEMDVFGFRSQFGMCYGGEETPGLFETVRGEGRGPGQKAEGIKAGNFMATSVLGPLLVLNPPFTKYLLRLLGQPDKLAYEEKAFETYELRKKEFTEPGRGFDY